MDLTIAVISDLHIGESAISTDLNPFATSSSSNQAHSGFLSYFSELVKKEDIKPDILLIPGDISDRSHPNEYFLAGSVIAEICRILNLELTNVFAVLGNHDVNWTLIESTDNAFSNDTTGFAKRLIFASAEHNDQISAILTGQVGNQTQAPYFSIDENEKFVLVRYNSAHDDLPSKETHHGTANQQHLEELEQQLDLLNEDKDKYRIFLTHHHPTQLSDPLPNVPDFSILNNAENLLKLLTRHDFDMLIHGHKHVPKFKYHAEDGKYLNVLCAGSFSKAITNAWAGRVLNQFHLVKFQGRQTTTQYSKGEILSWAYRHGDWQPSVENYAGIRHRSCFGEYLSSAELELKVTNIIKELLERKPIVRWHEFQDAYPDCMYLDEGMLIGRVEKACAVLGAEFVLREEENIQKAMVIKSDQ